MISDSFLFEASTLFFIGWIVILTGLGLAAFGPDLLASKIASKARSNSPRKTPRNI
ncbi:MAG TPA: hypothetical protein VJQ54_03100 [Candidatus Sulfotelmatobacter sp.]|nr:hypothetical protein [Candidatus Sulfotelmatobacter sp.]